MGGHVLLHYNPSRCWLIKPLAAYLHNPIMRYSKQTSKERDGHEMEERAPSTAEEFERVAEEFKRVIEEKAEQGVASQTIEKAFDAAEDTTLGDSNLDSVNNRYKESSQNENYQKTGDD